MTRRQIFRCSGKEKHMLVLSRRREEKIHIGDAVITVLAIQGTGYGSGSKHLRTFTYFAMKCRDINQLHRINSRELKPSHNSHVNARRLMETRPGRTPMLRHSRFQTDAPAKLVVADRQTDFLRANSGQLGRRQKERQQE